MTKKMIEAGQKMASDLMDAMVSKCMGNMGGHIIKEIENYKNSDLIKKYINNEISSVEAIYISMVRAKNKGAK
jgi:hypothetical protein